MKTKLITALSAAGVSLAAVNVNAQELTWTASAGVESEYVFRGVEIASESFQASIEGAYGDGYFGVWMNESLEDEDKGASEYDFYAGYGYAINDTLTADFGATLYHYPDADDETFEIYTGLSLDAPLAPSFYVYYDFDLEALTLEGSVSKSYDVAEKTALELGAAAGWVDSDLDEGAEFYYYNATADLVYSFNETTTASIGARVGGNDGRFGEGGKDDNAWAGVSFSKSF
ncbi:TorF family putative porin [Pelagicoccus sp. SDUM812003]|uniref:TorF family putative porin n=1 Tax=Pelagicoccus sp. SDUM812003 TaxID=3041267 RepID=UPI00280CA8FC|nr:TorF family putative porin [Pelagicoccus sp. SDUM812003]MDQ8204513.1 TorF family putative porin [Pelagicoccus sp. SDUM812003]